jgi:hypothetical protein
MADNILPFPVPHRGEPDPRRMALASIGFQWRAGLWRWTRRRPRPQGRPTPNQRATKGKKHHDARVDCKQMRHSLVVDTAAMHAR